MNLSQPLIGLGGRLRSGKDVVADFLVAEHGFVKLGMSDALHEAMLAINPIVTADLEPYSDVVDHLGYTEAKKIGEIRRLLQNLGTDVGRNMIGEDVWVNIMARKIDDHRGAGHPVVVTGIRFPNEVRMIEELNGHAVWIERPGLQAPTAGTASHASENSVSAEHFKNIIHNTGTLADLEERADSYARFLSAQQSTIRGAA